MLVMFDVWSLNISTERTCDDLLNPLLHRHAFIAWANSVDPDRVSIFVPSDQDLHCLLLDSVGYF